MAESSTGTTSRAHIERLMTEVESTLGEAFATVRLGKPRPQEREALARRLAGVVGSVETMRIWLAAGAP